MNRRGILGTGIAALVATALTAAGRPVNAMATVEVIPGEVGPTWVALGNRWAQVVYQDGQPTIGWTGRYDEAGEFQWDEFGTFLPGYVDGEAVEAGS